MDRKKIFAEVKSQSNKYAKKIKMSVEKNVKIYKEVIKTRGNQDSLSTCQHNMAHVQRGYVVTKRFNAVDVKMMGENIFSMMHIYNTVHIWKIFTII